MAQHLSRRRFLRQALALTLAGAAEACGQPAAQAPQDSALPAPPAPTAIPATPPAAPTASGTPLGFRGDRAMQHAAAQMQWVPRDTGTPGWQKCGDYIAEQLKAQGWQVEEQGFPYRGVQCRNIIGKRGSGPRIIVGAHYDARRYADAEPEPSKRSLPVPAANDGASGVAVLLELARVARPEDFGREVWLAAFDAEDNGEIDGWQWTVGSAYLAQSLSVAPQAVVVLDMIGDADQQIFYEGNSDQPIRQAIWGIAAELGYASFVPQVRHSMLDDHTPFLQRGYRAVDLIDFDYPFWHTAGDTLDKISAASLEAVGRTIEQWLLRGGPEATPAYPSPAAGYMTGRYPAA